MRLNKKLKITRLGKYIKLEEVQKNPKAFFFTSKNINGNITLIKEYIRRLSYNKNNTDYR